MAALPGWDAALYIAGTPTATTGEATSNTTGDTYRIDDVTKRVIDPRQTVTVYEDGTPTAKTVTIDYLRGLITFDSAPTTPVTVDYTYLPQARVGCPRSWEISLTRTNLDKTCHTLDGETGAGAMRRLLGLFDASGSMSDIDITGTVVGSETLRDVFRGADNDELMFFKVRMSTDWVWVGWIVFEEMAHNVEIDSIIEGSFNWNLASVDDAGYFSEGAYAA